MKHNGILTALKNYQTRIGRILTVAQVICFLLKYILNKLCNSFGATIIS